MTFFLLLILIRLIGKVSCYQTGDLNLNPTYTKKNSLVSFFAKMRALFWNCKNSYDLL